MARVIFEDLTLEQAEVFAHWFEGQGEQDCTVWFEEQQVPSPMTDVRRKGWLKVDKATQTVTVHCHTP